MVKHGADVSAVNKDGNMAFHVAAEHGLTSCIPKLLNRRAGINVLNYQLDTPLHIALYNRQNDFARILFKIGAQTSVPNEKGDTPRILAASLDNEELKKLAIYAKHMPGKP